MLNYIMFILSFIQKVVRQNHYKPKCCGDLLEKYKIRQALCT